MKDSRSGVLAWFAGNHVASNLLMGFLLFAGFLSLLNVVVEVFPEFDVDIITVSVVYLGATPAEVEEGSASGSRRRWLPSKASSD
jgi:multidrug efflux pump subunit AcrB